MLHVTTQKECSQYGLDINDHTALDLIGEVAALYEREAGQDNLSERTAIEQAAVDLTRAFWDSELWVVAYAVDQGYGGPEEGGWWYPTYEKVEAQRVEGTDWPTLLKLAETQVEATRYRYKEMESGTYGSFGGWQLFRVELELVPQGEEPGKAERVPRPTYC